MKKLYIGIVLVLIVGIGVLAIVHQDSDSRVGLLQGRVEEQNASVLAKRSVSMDQPMVLATPMIVNEVAYPGSGFITNTEEYKYFEQNVFIDPLNTPLSTFSIDVDTASYSNLRRFILNGKLPPKDAVRIEEMINYFTYDYPQPADDLPFSITTEVAVCPWNQEHYLARIGLQGREIELENIPPNNLVFLLDVSGSMNSSNKLPLLKSALKLLIQQLRPEDQVSIVVYAGAAGVILEPTSGREKERILDALEQLQAGGSTAAGEGINLAYDLAKEYYIKHGNNRIILATDGDFNVGISDERGLTDLIEEKRDEGIYLSVLGFGTGNIKDNKMELLADKGNGNYAYIDNILEAKKVLVTEMGSTLLTIAKDVKIQVEFNPAKIQEYRLIGYENRVMNNEDFADDRKDAGELGAGHTVTAIYELIPVDSTDTSRIDQNHLKYQEITMVQSEEWMTVKLRYKAPSESESQLISTVINNEDIQKDGSSDLLFASAVAELGLLLRDSEFKGDSSFAQLIQRAKQNKGLDEEGYRAEFIKLAEMVETLITVNTPMNDD